MVVATSHVIKRGSRRAIITLFQGNSHEPH